MEDQRQLSDLHRESLDLHAEHKGKIEIRSKIPITTMRDLTLAYTPGVAEVCREIERNRDLAYKYTIKSNTVAIVTDGSAVLGLGNIGGYAAIPVMEGKAMLFKEFANIDAFPICFEGYHTNFIDECFEVEEALQDIGIPVMHDDQHGTAVVVLAAVINASRVTGKSYRNLRIAIAGAGAAGFAITRILRAIGYDHRIVEQVREVIVCDTQGIIHRRRDDLMKNKYKYILAHETNPHGRKGTLADAIRGADVFIGVSTGGIVTEEMVASMAPNAIVLAMANPTPEIMPPLAKQAGAAVVGSGRSDFPNQVNNVLAFPGIFRGALDACATRITEQMKVAAAHALAEYIPHPEADRILPPILDRGVTRAVAEAVRKTAIEEGVVRKFSDCDTGT
jgi:malate dehydrogenase (oxaloacetate-decarboxylating)